MLDTATFASLVSQRRSFLTLLIGFTIVIVMQAVAFSFHEHIANASRIAYRESYLHHIIAETRMLEKTQTFALIRQMKQENNDNHDLSINTEPLFNLQFHHPTYTEINTKLPFDQPNVQFSIQLADKRWANYTIQLEPLYNDITQKLLVWRIVEIALLLSLYIYFWYFNRFSYPLNQFKKNAARLGIDIHSPPSSVHGSPQIRAISNAMQAMQKRISDILKKRDQMLVAISHDLKTPITRLHLRAQLLTDKEQQQRIIETLNEMDSMIDQIISFVKDSNTNEEKVSLDLVSLLCAICDEERDMGNDISFITLIDQIKFYGCSLALKRAFTNVIGNATKYAGKVWVMLEKTNTKYMITVQDNGKGINGADLEKVFLAFYRSPQSNRQTIGSGLGLTITREIIAFHKGTIALENRSSGGLCVTITLPIIK